MESLVWVCSWFGHFGEEKHLLLMPGIMAFIHKFTLLVALTVVSNEGLVSKW
jgi:hypothetical protein